MRSYLVVELPNQDAPLLRWVRDLGFTGVRHGLRMSDDWEHIRMVFDALMEVPKLSPLFLLPFEERYHDPNEVLEFTEVIASMIKDWGYDTRSIALEFCNEPNVFSEQWKREPEFLGELFVKAIPRIRKWAKEIKILTPSVANLDQSSQGYARRLFAPIKAMARDYHIAFHRYPHKKHGPHPGFVSRQEEFVNFVNITTDGIGREYWCTETGYSQWGRRPKPFPLCLMEESYKRSEVDQALFCNAEYDFWFNETNVQALTWYQINDGDGEDVLDGYGIRTFTGKPKQVAGTLKDIHEMIRSNT